MIYAVSDLHGYPFDKFRALLDSIGFSDEDFLYILGDAVDRGADGIKYIRYIRTRRNMKLLMGNHEDMMLGCEFLFDIVTDDNIDMLTTEKLERHIHWTMNGGLPTIDALRGVRESELKHIFWYLRRLPLYERVSAGGRDFILCHSGLGNFRPDKPLEEYTKHELLWTRPELSDRFFEDGTITVFGHTPTMGYSDEYKGKPIFTDTWINIDAGAAYGEKPALLRLDDLKVFYPED